MRSNDLTLFWAKTNPHHSLLFHMIDVGNVAISLVSTPSYSYLKEKLSKALGCPDDLVLNWIGFFAALHDIGKCDPNFQLKLESDEYPELYQFLETNKLKFPIQSEIRHEFRSRIIMIDYLESVGFSKRTANLIGEILGGHHSHFENKMLEYDDIKKYWKPYRDELIFIVARLFQISDWKPEEFPDETNAVIPLLGIIVFSDWIASNHLLFKYEGYTGDKEDPEAYFKFSKNMAESAVSDIELSSALTWENDNFADIWSFLNFTSLRPVQQTCESIIKQKKNPGLIIIEAPMGEGKTESAVYLATQWIRQNNLGGFYIALPTAATSNQMHDRISDFMQYHSSSKLNNSISVQLVHGMAWLLDDKAKLSDGANAGYESSEDNKVAEEWFRPQKRALLSPYAVGTIDQALMSVLKVKFGFLRLFGLTGKVLIVDEVHAYDFYTGKILNRLIEWCSALNIPVILLSATFPSDKKLQLINVYSSSSNTSLNESYPLITYVSDSGDVEQFPVSLPPNDKIYKIISHSGCLQNPEKAASLAYDLLQNNSGCICVIANTVKTAQEIYRKLNALNAENHLLDNSDILLFHSRFKAGRREEIEKSVLKLFGKDKSNSRSSRPAKSILVSTQVVEQSLDLDFDLMISELAPSDLLLQRMGRLCRHERKFRPFGDISQFHILLPDENGEKFDFKSTEIIYHKYILLRTLLLFKNVNEISIPKDLREIIEFTYTSECNAFNSRNLNSPGLFSLDQNILNSEKSLMNKSIDEDINQTGHYLLQSPVKSGRFTLFNNVNNIFSYFDEEGSSYFNAKTRIGSDMTQLLMIEQDEFENILSAYKNNLPFDVLKKLFKNIISIPTYRLWSNG